MEKHDDDMPKDKIQQAKRWRLILGQYADDALGQAKPRLMLMILKLNVHSIFFIAVNISAEDYVKSAVAMALSMHRNLLP